MNKITYLILVSFFLMGCHTMVLKNGNKLNTNWNNQHLHHIVFYGAIEASAPVNLQRICNNQNSWQTVQTKRTFVTELLKMFTQGLYTPQEVSVSCQ